MEHLIANSGIHFITREIEFNPSEPLVLSNGSALKYSFSETIDFLEGKKVFSLLTSLIMVISLLGIMPAMSVGALTSGDYLT